MGSWQSGVQKMMLKMNHLAKGVRSGFTLVEMMVVITLIGILMAIFLERALFYQEQAEKAAMEQTRGTLQSALSLKFATLAAQGRIKEVPELVKENPMTWLLQRPSNYLGEYYAPKAEDVVSGHWYFDLQQRNLIYSVNNKSHFHSEEHDKIRFQVKLVTGTVRSQGRGEALDNNNIEGVILEQVVPYTWF
jgi:prepilin-type N-terminal cleavage/methylation domain-containing protein